MFRRNEKDPGAGNATQDLPIADATRVSKQELPITAKKKKKNAIPIPPPFLIPTGTMNLSNVTVPNSKGWGLSSRNSKHCTIITKHTAVETKRLRELRIPIENSEIVVYIFAKKNYDDMKKSIENDSLTSLAVKRTHRSALLTRGSVQFNRLPFNMKTLFFGKDTGKPNINVSIFDLRGFHVSHNHNVAIIAFQDRDQCEVPCSYREQQNIIQYALYQTPDVERFLFPLTATVVAAYCGTPRWAIPITWSGNLPTLPAIPEHKYTAWMGVDGGFSSSVYAAALAYCVKNEIDINLYFNEERAISELVLDQQPSRSWYNPTKSKELSQDQMTELKDWRESKDGQAHILPKVLTFPQVIDLMKLAKALEAGNLNNPFARSTHCILFICIAGLNALTFNLVFRKLKLTDTDIQSNPALRNALSRTLLYNVTLREVDFNSSNLTGLGESIGNALAMNAQPLISRVNFSNCQLTDGDLRGLLHGLARIWCGGTALAESICVAKNMNISTKTWDLFFETFVDPSTLSSAWPQNTPPPPNLSFLQELDLRDTKAIGPGLIEFSKKLHGLRYLKLSSFNGGSEFVKVLNSLAVGTLEKFEGIGLDTSCIEALFRHCNSLKEVTLNGFKGDAGLLLCGWPQSVPNLLINIGSVYIPSNSPWINPPETGHSPGTLSIYNDEKFGVNAMDTLSSRANGLKRLVIYNMYYWHVVTAAPILAGCGLESLHVYSPSKTSTSSITRGYTYLESFWSALATSKTLRDLQLPDQFTGYSKSDEVAMIGRFLRSNRSVQRIGFDSSSLILKVEDMKVLRSAFYGNKKVIDMEYLSKARQLTMNEIRKETKLLIANVNRCKAAIKNIFKSYYSKYNRNWRNRPNQLKLPLVEEIRVAKRKIGKLQRESNKIGQLLAEIGNCVAENKKERAVIEEEKGNARLARRENQLQQLATKKKKIITNLVTKLNKAKIRGRQKKSSKRQLPRSTYYKSKHAWPNTSQPTQNRHVHSYYNYYNDPYFVRNHWYNYSATGYGFSNNNIELDQEIVSDNPETNAAWDCMLSEVEGISCEQSDPWAVMDALIHEADSDYSTFISPEYLASLHEEASELGLDVVSDLCSTLDDGAAVADKLDEIRASTNVSSEMITAIVDSSLGEQFDLIALESTLDDIPEYEVDANDFIDGNDDFVDENMDEDNIMDADDAVGMYAGAGPRDLDDGGPSFCGFGNAALAGARRRAIARKDSRMAIHARKKANRRLQTGYKNLVIVPREVPRVEKCIESVWPNDLANSWVEETNFQQVQAMAKIDLFDLPEATNEPLCLLTEWSYGQNIKSYSTLNIEVVLVSQCSLDRLKNLEAQLACWTGKASIAVYLKPGENRINADRAIMASIKNAKEGADKKQPHRNDNFFDVAVTIVEGYMDDEPYPINYLRNVALLEARSQHLRFNASLDKSAVLLVDVDFRPSNNLYETVHSGSAAESIMKQRRVVVCPAFESTKEDCAQSITSLRALVMAGQAEGFHLSHFPQGHSPTQFDKFWNKSLQYNGGNSNVYWEHSYKIQYEKLFEPYIIMASADVPLYDERFQGYGLNKVTHLATVALQKNDEFFVLPGVFLIAPAHDRSESWLKRYGTRLDDETKFNQLVLKGLYHNFMENLEDGRDVFVSENSKLKDRHLVLLERDSKREEEESKSKYTQNNSGTSYPTKSLLCY